MDDVNEAQQINHLPAFYSCHDFFCIGNKKVCKSNLQTFNNSFTGRQQKKSAN
jgi:hypothetical protein